MKPPKPMFNASAILGLFSLLGIGLVAVVHDSTKARIADNQRAVLLYALESLIPPKDFDNDLVADTLTVDEPTLDAKHPVTIYRARKRGKPVAMVLSATAPDGYNGPIKLLVAVRADGVLEGVRVIDHRETPGLGDPIDADKSAWILGFAGRSLENPPEPRWKVKRDGGDFDQFTGATISPRAVVKAVQRTLVFFKWNKAWLFDEPAGTRL